MDKMILVTGGTGLVGGHLLWHLLQKNERVVAIRRLSSSMTPLHTIFSFYCSEPERFLSRIDWVSADVLHAESLQTAMSGATYVYHCAAVVSLSGASDALLDTNVTGTRNVVDAAIANKVKKLCFVSSIAACGKPAHSKEIDENSVWIDDQNRSQYSKSKYYSEQEVWRGCALGLDAVIVNPGVILGVSGTVSGSSRLFAMVKKGLLFYSNGGSGYVDVRDVVETMILLMDSDIKNERFVLVGENCSNKYILGLMADGYRKFRPFIPIPKRLLLAVGVFFEKLGVLFHFQPPIDKSSARSASNREFYSSSKVVGAIGFRFRTIAKCIEDVCAFDTRSDRGF